MTTEKTLAVLLSTYNGAKYLAEFLESLKKQTYKNFILFVRDDGSVDNSLAIVNAYSKLFDIIILPSYEQLGPAKSFMTLLEYAGDTFDYYSFADQDDYWNETKIERAVSHIITFKEKPVLYCSAQEYVNENLEHIKYSLKPKFIGLNNALVENIAVGCTIVINKPARTLVLGALPESYIMHDWWMYLLMSAFGQVIYDQHPTIKYRQHNNNTIGVATNICQEYYRKLERFINRDKGVFTIFLQATHFKLCFNSHLTQEQVKLLDFLLRGKINFIKRITLSFFSPFIRQKRVDRFILRILFLINRY